MIIYSFTDKMDFFDSAKAYYYETLARGGIYIFVDQIHVFTFTLYSIFRPSFLICYIMKVSPSLKS